MFCAYCLIFTAYKAITLCLAQNVVREEPYRARNETSCAKRGIVRGMSCAKSHILRETRYLARNETPCAECCARNEVSCAK